MAIIQTIPLSGSGGGSYLEMTTDEAIEGTNTEERVISAKVLNDAIDNKIPTVNNAKLTIQKNGTTVKTFTANASANVTCNIEVPTKVSDLTNDSGFLTEHQDISNKADKATTLSGYGITDAYTKSQVDKKVSDLVNSAPETLDTLNELASALGNDPNFATTVSNQIGNKADDDKVVHNSGTEVIDGYKSFIKRIAVTPADIGTSGYTIITPISRGDTNIQSANHATFRVQDKNNAIIGEVCIENYTDGNVAQAFNIRNTNDNGDQVSSTLVHSFNKDATNDVFYPNRPSVVSLGNVDHKWADVNTVLLNGKTPAYADDISGVAHLSGAETFTGNKTFTGSVSLPKDTEFNITEAELNEIFK